MGAAPDVRTVPIGAATTRPALRVMAGEAIAFRRNWRGFLMSSFGNPVAFLAAMGVGLGTLVDRGGGTATLEVDYVAFVAAGLLAASAMQNGFGDGAWPVMAGLKWRRNFEAMMATPVGPRDLFVGRLLWATVTFAGNLLAFGLVAILFGALDAGPVLLGILPALLTGLAFQALSTAYTAGLKADTGLTNAYRFGIMPLFLFSGTFFPITQLPTALQWVAVATPLYHGVELTRKVALPELGPPVVSTIPVWVHVAYLVAMFAGGAWWAVRRLDRRLYT